MSAVQPRSLLLTASCYLLWISTAGAATLPAGFSETRVATGLVSPTAMAIAPDGRVFVTEKGGALRVVKNDALLPEPFLTLSVSTTDTRGLLGVAFDPDFQSNGFVYVYYTTADAPIHPRVSRFTASSTNPDVAQAGSELPIRNLPRLPSSAHIGGAIHFGNDGKLYVAVGDNSVPANSQSLSTALGKLLRINRDGSIPSDNPFYSQTGADPAIWALGLRNPYTFAVDSVTARIHINDVGQNSWEEVNLGVRGANYGWPQTEGPVPAGSSGVQYPIYAYPHAGSDCAIVGATFYRPQIFRFPPAYAGRYFFGDFCTGFIQMLSPPNYSNSEGFATGISSLVDIQTHHDGSLYYLASGGGELFRVQSTTSTIVFNDNFESELGWTLTRRELRHPRSLAAGRPGAHHQRWHALAAGLLPGFDELSHHRAGRGHMEWRERCGRWPDVDSVPGHRLAGRPAADAGLRAVFRAQRPGHCSGLFPRARRR